MEARPPMVPPVSSIAGVGNIPKFYSILPLIRYVYQSFSLQAFLPFSALWVFFFPGGAVM